MSLAFEVIAYLILVIALMVVSLYIMKNLGEGRGLFAKPQLGSQNQKRLKIVEAINLDAKRKAVIISCDEVEHLVLIGGNTDLLLSASGVSQIAMSTSMNSRTTENSENPSKKSDLKLTREEKIVARIEDMLQKVQGKGLGKQLANPKTNASKPDNDAITLAEIIQPSIRANRVNPDMKPKQSAQQEKSTDHITEKSGDSPLIALKSKMDRASEADKNINKEAVIKAAVNSIFEQAIQSAHTQAENTQEVQNTAQQEETISTSNAIQQSNAIKTALHNANDKNLKKNGEQEKTDIAAHTQSIPQQATNKPDRSAQLAQMLERDLLDIELFEDDADTAVSEDLQEKEIHQAPTFKIELKTPQNKVDVAKTENADNPVSSKATTRIQDTVNALRNTEGLYSTSRIDSRLEKLLQNATHMSQEVH